MNAFSSLVCLHLRGEDQNTPSDDLTLDTLPGKFTLTRTEAALTAYGGLVVWSGFLKHLGIIERFSERCPIHRTSPNAAPVREVVHSFTLSALVEGKRFCHVRWLADDPAIATIMNLERVRGEDALPRLMGLTPGHHSEAIKSRRDFLFLAAQVVESGRQRVVKLAVKAEWWRVLKACYERLRAWLISTAPQLEATGEVLRRLARQTTENTDDTLLQPASG